MTDQKSKPQEQKEVTHEPHTPLWYQQKSLKELTTISKNVQFFFWITLIGIIAMIGIMAEAMNY